MEKHHEWHNRDVLVCPTLRGNIFSLVPAVQVMRVWAGHAQPLRYWWAMARTSSFSEFSFASAAAAQPALTEKYSLIFGSVPEGRMQNQAPLSSR